SAIARFRTTSGVTSVLSQQWSGPGAGGDCGSPTTTAGAAAGPVGAPGAAYVDLSARRGPAGAPGTGWALGGQTIQVQSLSRGWKAREYHSSATSKPHLARSASPTTTAGANH